MTRALAIFRRELLSYATTPSAYVFVAVFLLAATGFTFQGGQFFALNRADLSPFFLLHPWLFVVFLPAIGMRLWADEIRSGTLETLLTLPIPTWALVVGKHLAAWAVAGIALALTAPLWITVNLLGAPDNGAILAAYIASFLMAGAYLAIAQAMSALTGVQSAAFVMAAFLGFLLTALGAPIVAGFVGGALGPQGLDALSSVSILTHFDSLQRGVLEARAVFFFLSLTALFLAFAALAVNVRRGG